MIETSPCEHCQMPVEFEVSEWNRGYTKECPSCGLETVIHFNKAASKPRLPRPMPSAPPAPPRKIEDNLEAIGIGYLVLNAAAAVFIGFAAIPHMVEGRTERVLLMFGIALGLVVQGFIVKSVFSGFAEIIKLLRKRAA